jgi:ABC-type branched-subunit amino acid transport system substrate-binding protein
VVQALAEAKPDAIFSSLFAADLQKFVREGNTRGLFRNTVVLNLLAGEPEYLDPLKDETPQGWWVTGYPWSEIDTPEHKRFRDAYQKRWKDYPRQGSVVGYTAVYSVANAVRKAKSADTEKLVEALKAWRCKPRLARSYGARSTTSRRWARTSASSRRKTARARWSTGATSTAPGSSPPSRTPAR